jgi:hypothetical protein
MGVQIDSLGIEATSSKGAMRRLRGFLGNPLPAEEAMLWAELSERQRAKALQRMAALTRWNLRQAPHDAVLAAANAGLKHTARFYEMAKAWGDAPSLKVLGVLATAPRTRRNRHEDLLSERARELVDAHPGESVRQLALKLGETPGLGDKPPTYNTLRRFVDDEIRRRNRKKRPGTYVGFDCCACSMQRMDGSEYTLFAIVDQESQLILGAALGDAADSRRGYAGAAADALARLGRSPLAGVAWVDRTEGFQLVVGVDSERWNDIRSEVAAAGVGAPIEPSTRRQRFGRYVRPAVGPRLGRIALSPTKTHGLEGEGRSGSPSMPTADDITRLVLEVEAHNRPLVDDLEHADGSGPPADLITLLHHLAPD